MRRLRCYISGPLTTGNLADNVNRATDSFHKLLKAGLAPFLPHLSVFADGCHTETREFAHGQSSEVVVAYGHPTPRESTYEEWMALDLSWVEVAECVLRIGGDSKGADREVLHAISRKIPVFYTEEAVIDWARKREADDREACRILFSSDF